MTGRDDLIDTLRTVQHLHRTAIKSIDDFIANAQRGKVNTSGTTGPARSVPSNTISKTPGPRGDLFKTPAEMQDHLTWLKKKRAEEELKIKLRDEITLESNAMWAARMELSEPSK